MVLTRTLYGEEAAKHPDLLPEREKERIRTLSSAVAAVVGGAVGSGSGGSNAADVLANAQVGGVVGRNAVVNNIFGEINDMDMNGDEAKRTRDEEIRKIAVQYFNNDTNKAEEFIRGRYQGAADGLKGSFIDTGRGLKRIATRFINEGFIGLIEDSARAGYELGSRPKQHIESIGIDAAKWKIAYDHALTTDPHLAGHMNGALKGRGYGAGAQIVLARGIAEYPPLQNLLRTTSGSTRRVVIPKRRSPSQAGSRQMSTIDGEMIGYPRTAVQQNITSRGTSIEYVQQGTLEMAKQDLDALRPHNLRRSADGRVLMGTLQNGNFVKLRPSNDGGRHRWTIEITKPNGRTVREIRYGDL